MKAVATPEKPKQGKRTPSFRKLQRRHRTGPSTFRQQQEEKQLELSKTHPKDRQRGKDVISLQELQLGQQFQGIVQNLVPHGAFVDIGATRDGLVHMRDFDVEFIHIPSDKVRSGDRVNVWVKYVDPIKNVLALTMMKPTRGLANKFPVKDVVDGTKYQGYVERITNFGAFIDIGAERMAFLHIADLWGEDRRETLDYLRLGQKLWVYVLSVDTVKSFIKLSARGVGGRILDKEGPIEVKGLRSKKDMEQDSGRTAVRRPWDDDEEAIQSVKSGRRASALWLDDDPKGWNESEYADSVETEDDENDMVEDDDDENEDEEDEFAFADTDFDVIDDVFSQSNELDRIRNMLDKNTEYIGIDPSEI